MRTTTYRHNKPYSHDKCKRSTPPAPAHATASNYASKPWQPHLRPHSPHTPRPRTKARCHGLPSRPNPPRLHGEGGIITHPRHPHRRPPPSTHPTPAGRPLPPAPTHRFIVAESRLTRTHTPPRPQKKPDTPPRTHSASTAYPTRTHASHAPAPKQKSPAGASPAVYIIRYYRGLHPR